MKKNVNPANKESRNYILKVYIWCTYAEYSNEIKELESLPSG